MLSVGSFIAAATMSKRWLKAAYNSLVVFCFVERIRLTNSHFSLLRRLDLNPEVVGFSSWSLFDSWQRGFPVIYQTSQGNASKTRMLGENFQMSIQINHWWCPIFKLCRDEVRVSKKFYEKFHLWFTTGSLFIRGIIAKPRNLSCVFCVISIWN